MSESSQSVHEHRVRAAEMSLGRSSNVIYDCVERVLAENNLGGKLLDYGAGTGELTQRILEMKRFESVSAADIMPVPEGLAGKAEWIEMDLNSPLPLAGETFDVIVAAEVIEHLENPRFVVRELFRMLKPGGVAVISTPNNESWRSLLALLVRGNFVAFTDTSYPAHITALVRQDIRRIFLETHFSVPRFYFTNSGGLPGMPHVTWQRVSFGVLGGVRYSDNLIAVATKPAR
jgi:2-polyprenyl-3-methyl-5-hydroxy-6-metoxy-1,4-benzoquinol methylase